MPGPLLIWTTRPPARSTLRRAGFRILSWRRFRKQIVATRRTGTTRGSLDNPAAAWFATLVPGSATAILDAPCADAAELHLLYGYLIEPAWRRRVHVLIHAAHELADLDPGRHVDRDWRYPWTLERLQRLAGLMDCRTSWPPYDPPRAEPSADVGRWRRLHARVSRRDDTRQAPGAAPATLPRPLRLDNEQAAAVRAGDGVVQVIAPAGSGKTSVLIERVKELRHRGVDPASILCTSFNRDAKTEITARLAREGIDGVVVRSFHGLGLEILRGEERLRGAIGGPTPAQWRELARQALAAWPDGVRLDPVAAQEAVSTFKLARLVDPAEAVASAAPADAAARTAASLYALHEDLLTARGLNDFDDLIMRAVRLLQDDAAVRRRWQARFSHVLVDEYQDIEPAQALLVGLVAAPQDALFCVGDEDQCIYAWRRATVTRVIELDQVYPALERYPLVRNYRCGAVITDASRRLIEHNRCRFRKPLLVGASNTGALHVWREANRRAGADRAASLLTGADPHEAVVLARTSLLLQEVALACAARGIAYRGSERLARPPRAVTVLAALLRLVTEPRQATRDDLAAGLAPWIPSLPADTGDAAAADLRAGAPFADVLLRLADGAPAAGRQGALLDTLGAERDAGRVVGRLRREAGLDRALSMRERLNGVTPQAVDALAAAERRAFGLEIRRFSAVLAEDAATLAASGSPAGVELATVHAAKGREWPHVIIHGCDQGQFPHAQSLVDAGARAGLEDERRLFYVALTRAKQRLDLVCTAAAPSVFVTELEPR